VSNRLTVHRLAELELNDAARYYERESPGLALAFLDAVERTSGEIVEYPEAGPILRGTVRRRLVRGFPYGLLYSITPEGVRILAVMNLKRRPFYWLGRS